jgi:hypothetical protein
MTTTYRAGVRAGYGVAGCDYRTITVTAHDEREAAGLAAIEMHERFPNAAIRVMHVFEGGE